VNASKLATGRITIARVRGHNYKVEVSDGRITLDVITANRSFGYFQQHKL